MAIDLHVSPRKVMSWDEFRTQMPKYSIALDGFVEDKTRRDPKGPYANFDHHSDVDRLATRSTSDQVQMEIRMGLFDTFRKDGLPEAQVYINDPDEDTCLAWWLLKHHETVRYTSNPSVNRLVWCEDRLDSTAGAYPFGDIEMRRRMAWIFAPYNSARFTGAISTMKESEMRSVVEAVESRITRYVFGDGGEEIALDGNFKRVGGGTNWALTEETGPASRMAMYQEGIKAFAAIVARKDDGSYVYTIGRNSVWTPFPIPALYDALNIAEGELIKNGNRWSGSDTIGGSPRSTGSRLKPHELEEIVEKTVREEMKK